MGSAVSDGRVSGGRVVSLDGIRGIAALFVMVYHLPLIFGFAISHAYLAVDLFFMLSGWVMAYSYAERIREGMAFRQFALQRFARLYPLYAVALALGSAFALVKYLFGTPTAATLACFVPNSIMLPCMLDDPENFPLNRPAWSIFVEVAINLAWYFVVRHGMSTVRWKFAWHLGAVLLCWGAALMAERFLRGYTPADVHEGLLRGLLGFSAGILLFHYRKQAWILAYFAALSLAVLLVFARKGQSVDLMLHVVAIMALFPALLWLLAAIRPRILEGKVSAFLGDISYAVYLLHVPLGLILINPLLRLIPGAGLAPTAVRAALFTAVLIALSSLSYHRLEKPARRWLVARYGKPGRPMGAAATP
ncbi:acyltransferase [Janthinobacterium sp. SUN118]|uniref:acyltransferase family protein n=1 Tax=Janthinobacterium sp. SUN118 TaxID=3004100 RepID=UPI0025B25C58|nr:acyltransferase [Janthinobacterium sp. SUN118]MDN2709977.1 acyltransferase [Janthinobacterium sp. SUN118]